MRRRPSMPSPQPTRWPHFLVAVLALSLVAAAMPSAAAAIDTTPPIVAYSIDGIAGSNNWYRGSSHGNNIVVHWSVSDPESPILSSPGCEPAILIPGPNTGTTRTCSATSDGGTTTITTRLLKIDASAPSVAATLSRGPDFNGWYNHPVGVSWHGSDATSGIASCSALAYAGPDRAGARIGGGCVDRAGNGVSTAVSINYDATAPVLGKLSVKSKAGSDLVRWKSSSPSDTAVIQRWARGNKQPAAGRGIVFRGSGESFSDGKIKSNVEYTYAVQTFDQAGNASQQATVVAFAKVLTLGRLTYTPRAAPNPILRWGRSRNATYYHVQLFRGSKRIFAAWPPTHQLGLSSAWKWNGHRYRLRPGRYRWYVWAGLGKRSFARYHAIGSAQFIIPR